MSDKFVVGAKQTSKAIINNTAKLCYIAQDADEKIINNIIELCNNNKIPVIYVESMKELGKKFKVNIGAATAVELK